MGEAHACCHSESLFPYKFSQFGMAGVGEALEDVFMKVPISSTTHNLL